MEEYFRELSRAIHLGDIEGAKIILGVFARDRPKFSHPIDLGRSDAAAIRARPPRPEVVTLDQAA